MPKQPRFLTPAQMSELTTPRLLAYKNRLHKVVDGPDWDALYEGGADRVQHKARAEWQAAMDACKELLSKREHSPKKVRGPKP